MTRGNNDASSLLDLLTSRGEDVATGTGRHPQAQVENRTILCCGLQDGTRHQGWVGSQIPLEHPYRVNLGLWQLLTQYTGNGGAMTYQIAKIVVLLDAPIPIQEEPTTGHAAFDMGMPGVDPGIDHADTQLIIHSA